MASTARITGHHRLPRRVRKLVSTAGSRLLGSSAVVSNNDGSNPHYPRMFDPLYLGPDIGSLPNRVLMGSMHTGLEGHSIPGFVLPFLNAQDDHTDLTEMACYFAERAKGGVGLMGESVLSLFSNVL